LWPHRRRARSRRHGRRPPRQRNRRHGQGGMAPSRPGGASGGGGGAMIFLGRVIGLFVLCILVGLFLESIGITAQGLLTDTWHTLGELFHKLRDLVEWSLPYALL